MNAQNERLHERVVRAAARTTALNEIFLRRISADLHDGPGQDLGLALMQIDAVTECGGACEHAERRRREDRVELSAVRSSLKAALADVRAIATGLQLPDIAGLSVNEVVARAVRDYEGKTSARVRLEAGPHNSDASLPVKIALYRLLQESLSNGFRHAGGVGQRVDAACKQEHVMVEVSDGGPGFDPEVAAGDGHLGLAGMRERVEVLGGTFVLHSAPGEGATIRICLPLFVPGLDHE